MQSDKQWPVGVTELAVIYKQLFTRPNAICELFQTNFELCTFTNPSALLSPEWELQEDSRLASGDSETDSKQGLVR